MHFWVVRWKIILTFCLAWTKTWNFASLLVRRYLRSSIGFNFFLLKRWVSTTSSSSSEPASAYSEAFSEHTDSGILLLWNIDRMKHNMENTCKYNMSLPCYLIPLQRSLTGQVVQFSQYFRACVSSPSSPFLQGSFQEIFQLFDWWYWTSTPSPSFSPCHFSQLATLHYPNSLRKVRNKQKYFFI